MRLPVITISIIAAAIVIATPALKDKKQAQIEAVTIQEIKENSYAETEETVEDRQIETVAGIERETEEVYVSPYDFVELHKENKDIVAWINIPGSNIDYPVMFDGTDRYLHENLMNEPSSAGSIYVDANAKDALKDRVNIIYGHHMKDGSMFSDVDDFGSEEFWNSHTEVNIYMEDGELSLHPITCVVGPSDPELWNISDSKDLRDFCEGKVIAQGEIPDEWDHLYVLVTCNYSGSNYRTYVILKEA